MSAVQAPPATRHLTRVLSRADVRRLLDMRSCIDAVEEAFRRFADGRVIPPAVLGVHVEGGGFHVKTAGTTGDADGGVFVAKVNANFPSNPRRVGLPTIQGVIALFDAIDGRVLAILDSIEITSVRTAAATAVAAKYLARPEAATLTLCGCGEQGRSQLRAVNLVRPLRRVMVYDLDSDRARRFASEMSTELGLDVTPVRELGAETRTSDIWVTCTTARGWFVGREHVAPGAFVAAVGADNPEKQEIEPQLLAASAVVVDVLDQCAAIGDLHHALDAGVMQLANVRATLADIVSGQNPGRAADEEIVVFDSTGTALQDVAAARLVHERAVSQGVGLAIELGAIPNEQPLS
jgi:ornithine cyclodeaminase/alanine dehydrogenase-like protein (mu-crystallin family)